MSAPSDPQEAIRVRRASDCTASASDLLALADDSAVTVRAALALNPAMPMPTLYALAHDPDDRVRALLARRMASLLPSLTAPHLSRLQEQVLLALRKLATDEAVRVRAALADVVKSMPQAPHDLVLHLAGDISMSVAEPVILLSPLLTDEDLLALLATAPAASTATAVARRPALSETVTRVIAKDCDVAAVEAMLHNATADIAETVLDELIARSASQIRWQAPLVRRPSLSPNASRALSHIVVSQLLAELNSRSDLPDSVAAAIAARLRCRMPEISPPSQMPTDGIDAAMRAANSMAQANLLTEAAAIAAAQRGDIALCIALIAVAANVDPKAVERACCLRSAKGLVSLIWRGGFSMRAAGPLQTLLARIPPDEILSSRDASSFPLTPDEMIWQIAFLKQGSLPTGPQLHASKRSPAGG